MLSAAFSDDDLLPPSESSHPKRPSKSSGHTSNNEIMKAYQVNVYKLVNGKYENKGRLGLALLGSKLNNIYSILIYGKANAIVAQAQINSEFNLTIAKELYGSFYDSLFTNWSVRFESMESFNDFVRRACIYKMLSAKLDYNQIDCSPGEGTGCQEGDLCEMEIVIYSIANGEILNTIYSTLENESNTVRIKIGGNKILPMIDKSTVGMSKGGIRVVSISTKSALLKSTQNVRIPSNTDVVIILKLIRFKSKVEKPIPEIEDNEPSLPNIMLDKAESELIDTKKSDLISRMAKMGKPIVGLNSMESNVISEPAKVFPTSAMSEMNPSYTISNQNPPNIYASPNVQIVPYQSPNQFLHTATRNDPPPNIQSHNDFNILFTETRQNNTEMRVALSKLQDKIDKIFEKCGSNFGNQVESRYMDAEEVYNNIKRIIDKNEILKKDCSDKTDMIDALNRKINELLKTNQRYLDDSHSMLERKSVSFNSNAAEHRNKILELEEEKLNLVRGLSQKTSELSQLQIKLDSTASEMEKYKIQAIEYSEKMTKVGDECNNLKLKNREILNELDNMKEERKNDNQKLNELESHKKNTADEINIYKSTVDDLKKNISYYHEKLSNIKNEYDNEITDIRNEYDKEISEWKNKLKMERQKSANKNSDLDNEIDNLNQAWEERFQKFQQAESEKLSKISEKNTQVMIENATLKRELLEVKENLSLSSNSQGIEIEQLRKNNKQLVEELNKYRLKREKELNKYQVNIGTVESELNEVKKEKENLEAIKVSYENLKIEAEKMRSQLQIMTQYENKDLKSIDNSGNEAIEAAVKNIMNDLFKKIRTEFESSETYYGEKILSKCMIIIRDSTIAALNAKKDSDSDDDEEEEESSDDANSGDDNNEPLVNKDKTDTTCSSENQLPLNIDDTSNIKVYVALTEHTPEVKESTEEVVKGSLNQFNVAKSENLSTYNQENPFLAEDESRLTTIEKQKDELCEEKESDALNIDENMKDEDKSEPDKLGVNKDENIFQTSEREENESGIVGLGMQTSKSTDEIEIKIEGYSVEDTPQIKSISGDGNQEHARSDENQVSLPNESNDVIVDMLSSVMCHDGDIISKPPISSDNKLSSKDNSSENKAKVEDVEDDDDDLNLFFTSLNKKNIPASAGDIKSTLKNNSDKDQRITDKKSDESQTISAFDPDDELSWLNC